MQMIAPNAWTVFKLKLIPYGNLNEEQRAVLRAYEDAQEQRAAGRAQQGQAAVEHGGFGDAGVGPGRAGGEGQAAGLGNAGGVGQVGGAGPAGGDGQVGGAGQVGDVRGDGGAGPGGRQGGEERVLGGQVAGEGGN